MSKRCYEGTCRRRGVFTVEPVEGFRVPICRPCFSARYKVAAPWLLKAKPVPKPVASVPVVIASESIKSMRPSGHGPAIPYYYRRARA